jgi:hypothetical protein
MKIVAIEYAGGERQVDLGFYGSVQVSSGSYQAGGLAVIRDQDGRTVAEYQAGKGWVIPDQAGVWDLVISDSDDEAV